jgi:RimJ/RimL family protein N-acetyltransferase
MWHDVDLVGSVVRLRPLRLSDCGALVAAATEDCSTYGYTWVPSDLDESRRHITIFLQDYANLNAVPLVVEHVGQRRIVGSTNYLDLDWLEDRAGPAADRAAVPPRAVEIGATWYASSVQRTAVNTECKLLMLSQAFDAWDVERVCFKTDARNSRSRRAIERIGGQSDGVRRAHMMGADGLIRDSACYSITRTEWPECRRRLEGMLACP